MSETYQFGAEIQSLMTLLINLIYNNKEVFLRELISNGADAITKQRLKVIQEENADAPADYKIRIIPNEAEKTLTITDNGIGMAKEELISRLGTIASSGTRSFIEATQNGADAELIGQFGIGFYSAFIVSNIVKVISKTSDMMVAYLWESSAAGTYTVSEYGEVDFDHGTKIIMYLKDD